MVWSVEFELDQAQRCTLVINGECWARGRDEAQQVSWSWAAAEGNQTIELPPQLAHIKDLHVVGVAYPWGRWVKLRFRWDGVEKQYMNFSKEEEKSFSY